MHCCKCFLYISDFSVSQLSNNPAHLYFEISSNKAFFYFRDSGSHHHHLHFENIFFFFHLNTDVQLAIEYSATVAYFYIHIFFLKQLDKLFICGLFVACREACCGFSLNNLSFAEKKKMCCYVEWGWKREDHN